MAIGYKQYPRLGIRSIQNRNAGITIANGKKILEIELSTKRNVMNLREKIGNEFKRIREIQKRSKREVAMSIGATPQRYGEWESGQGNITAESIEKVSKTLDATPSFKLKE